MQGLQLRREPDPPRCGGDVQRLDAEAVAGQEQRSRGRVPDREREHATQPLHALRAVLLVEMQDRLGVALSGERMSPRDQHAPELAEVVDLAVEDDRSEEHTSELQTLAYLVCRLLLEKKKKK